MPIHNQLQVFNLIRLGLFFLDHQLISSNIAKAKSLMEQGGDWDRKNRLRSYEGLYKMAVRDMSGAAELFLEAVPTFGSYELMRYEDLVFYAIVTSTLALERPDLREKVIKCNEIQEQLNGGGENGELVLPKEYLESFYECRYDDFFKKLAKVIDSRFKTDRFLEPHQSFYAKEMRVKSYRQFLAPYKTVSGRGGREGVAMKVYFLTSGPPANDGPRLRGERRLHRQGASFPDCGWHTQLSHRRSEWSRGDKSPGHEEPPVQDGYKVYLNLHPPS